MRTQTAQLARLAHLWLLTGSPTADQVAEKVVVDRLLRALPRQLRRPVRMKNPSDIASLVEAVEVPGAPKGDGAASAPRYSTTRQPTIGP